MANSISSALLVATSGLKAAQAGIDVVTRNVSSAEVEGYTRKVAPTETLALADTNSGVRTLEIRRFVNDALLRQLRVSNSTTERLEVEDDFLGRLETIFGKPGDDITVTAKIGALADAFRALSVSPDLGTSQFKVLSAASAMVQNFNLVSKTIRGLREEADTTIKASVDRINNALTVIRDLNLQVATFRAQGKSTAELEDQRDNQMNIIAEEIDISYFERDNGEIWISTRSGRSLLDAAYDSSNPPLTFNRTPIILPGTAYYPPPSSSLSGLGGLKVNGLDVTHELVGGKIAGYFAVRDDYLPQTESQLDELAAQLIEKLNFLDLQLFRDGTNTLPSALQAVVALTAGEGNTAGTGNAIEVLSVTGLSVGMSVKFANHAATYQITSIDSATVPNPTFTIEKVGATTGLDVAVPEFTNITFGPEISRLTNQTARAINQGVTGTEIQLTTTFGAQVGMRIQFANHDTIYTIDSVGPGAGQFTVAPDGSGTGLQVAIAANEAIRVVHPVPSIGGLSSRIQVNPAVTNNPWRTRDGTRVQTPSTLTGANTLPLAVVSMFETQQTFTANTGLTTSATIESFAASAVSFQAVRRQSVQIERDAQILIRDNFDQRFKNDSGVNVDQELAFMLQIQNSYAASARVISAIKEMMDELIRIA